jgi:hypothetical protein
MPLPIKPTRKLDFGCMFGIARQLKGTVSSAMT